MLATKVLGKFNKFQKVSFCNLHSAMVLTNSSKSTLNITDDESSKKRSYLGDMSTKYQVFQEQDSNIILDVYEERLKYSNLLEEEELEIKDPFEGLNLQRGENGVYEIEDLVDALKRENCENIFVAKLPKELKYVDYICLVSGKSQKHMQAIAQFVRRLYKQKRHRNDPVPKLEGDHSKDWMALDLGNIALHIFSRKARDIYDLDSLWALGPQFDNESRKKDPLSDMLEKHTIYLEGLEPAS